MNRASLLGVSALLFATGAIAFSAFSAACTDGTTPDCSSPDAGCGPDGAVFDVSVPDVIDAKADASDAADASLDAPGDDSATDAAPIDGAPSDSGDASND